MVSSFTIFLCREFSYSDGKINNKKQEKDRLNEKNIYKKIIMPLNKSEDAGPTSDFLQGGVGAELP